MSSAQALRNLRTIGSGGAISAGLLATFLTVGVLGRNSLFNVDGGHRAVVFSRVKGVKDEVYNEGTHICIPWFETPHIFDVRARPRIVGSLTGTKDLQMVNITVRVLSRPNVQRLPEVYRTLGLDFDEKVLPSIVNEVLKSVVAKFNASQLITQREHVSKQVRDHLVKRAANFNILLDDVSLTHVTFSPEFTHAVEAKQIAQQEAKRASFVVEKANQEKQSIIIKAQGEAQSAALIGNAVKKNPEFIELRIIDASKDIASTLETGKSKVYLDSNILMINSSKSRSTE